MIAAFFSLSRLVRFFSGYIGQRILAILQENDSKGDLQLADAIPSCFFALCPNFMETN